MGKSFGLIVFKSSTIKQKLIWFGTPSYNGNPIKYNCKEISTIFLDMQNARSRKVIGGNKYLPTYFLATFNRHSARRKWPK